MTPQSSERADEASQGHAAGQAQGWADGPAASHLAGPATQTLYHPGVVRERMPSDRLQWSGIKLLPQTARLPGDFLCRGVTLGPGLLQPQPQVDRGPIIPLLGHLSS